MRDKLEIVCQRGGGGEHISTSDGRIGDRNTGMKPNKKHTKKKKKEKEGELVGNKCWVINHAV